MKKNSDMLFRILCQSKRMAFAAVFLLLSLLSAGCSGPSDSSAKSEEIDVDLTKMSSTMIYSEVYNMLENPDEYVGKVIRMGGNFDVYETEEQNYYACVIQDALACCSEGLEFVCAKDIPYPDGYPVIDEPVTVTGVFQTYEENGYTLCHIVDAKMVF